MLTNWFLLDTSCYKKVFSKQVIEILILILIIPRNMLILHAKKIYTGYDKICTFEKNPHEIYFYEKKSRAEWSGISVSVIQQKHALTSPDLYRLILQSSYHTYLISPARWEIDETVNFRNFHELLWHVGNTFSNGKTKRSDRARSYKKIVLIKMNKMLYF